MNGLRRLPFGYPHGLRRVRRLLLIRYPKCADELLETMRRDLGDNVVYLSDRDLEREADFFVRYIERASA